MDRLHHSEWIEWLEGLRIQGSVEVEPVTVLPRPVGQCRLRAAEYAPFDDLVEVILEDDKGQVRVIIDHPKVIWVENEGAGDGLVAIDTEKGRITVRGYAGID